MVQWLRLRATNARGLGSIPAWGTRIPHAARCGPPKKNPHTKPQASTSREHLVTPNGNSGFPSWSHWSSRLLEIADPLWARKSVSTNQPGRPASRKASVWGGNLPDSLSRWQLWLRRLAPLPRPCSPCHCCGEVKFVQTRRRAPGSCHCRKPQSVLSIAACLIQSTK